MNIWEILGIAPTTDIAQIKAAYAAKAKLVHPEEHPEEFQVLQKAYKSAVKYAKMADNFPKNDFGAVLKAKNPSEPKIAVQPIENQILNSDRNKKTAENNKEKEQEIHTEQELEQKVHIEQEFVYDEISHEEKAQQCIQEMICLAQNIYLVNDLRCWEWFFSQPKYKSLYYEDAFRLNFVRTVQRLSGWMRKTILYIEAFLKQYQKSDSKKMETDTLRWKWLRRFRLLDFMRAKQKNVTNEQKRIHDILLSSVRNKGFSGNMQDNFCFLEYIKTYLEYAHNDRGKVEELYLSGLRATSFLANIIILVILFLFFALYFNAQTGNNKKTAQQQRVERWEQERQEYMSKWYNYQK